MELQMQYTYKGACISMIGEYNNKLSRASCKETVVICHNSNRNWEELNCSCWNSIWYTQLQAVKRFMKMVHELNEGIINIKTN